MAKKMTIVEMYEAIIAKGEGVLSKEELDFLQGRADIVAKKNATRKPTKAQEENEILKSNILDAMEQDKSYTCTEIMKLIGNDSLNKVNALVRQLRESGLVVRTESKGKAYFTKA